MSRTGRKRVSLLVLGALVLSPTLARAEAPRDPAMDASVVQTSPRERMPEIGLEPENRSIELRLDRAIEIALARNLPLAVQRYERAQFRLGIDESLGIYDFQLDGGLQASDLTQPTASQITGADVLEQERQNFDVTGSQLTPWGGIGRFTFGVAREESNSIFATLNPSYFTEADLGYTQPLLRNFGRDATERPIRIARLNSAANRQAFEQEVAATIQEVEEAYWSLVEARSQVEVAEESLELARELHEHNEVRVDVGTLAPVELVQSETGIATRQEERIRAEAAVGDAGDLLRQVLNLPPGVLWEVEIVPVTDPETSRTEIDLEEAMAIAFEERPELLAQELSVEALEADAAFFRDQVLPRLDLSVSYGYDGIGGDLTVSEGGPFDPTDPDETETVPGGISDALDQLADFEFDGWSVGLTFGYPLQNRSARARSAIADLEVEQGRRRLDDLALGIRTEVRRAVRAVRTAAEQIDSARATIRLAEENLESERKRLANGLSTSFQVLEVQEELTAARTREVAAVTAYRRALAGYHRAIGRLLEVNEVTILEEEEMRPPGTLRSLRRGTEDALELDPERVVEAASPAADDEEPEGRYVRRPRRRAGDESDGED